MRSLVIALVFLGAFAGPAAAQADLFSPDTVSGVVDLRLGASSGEPSWVEGGFGKSRLGGDRSGGVTARGEIASADLVWNPSVGDLSLVLDLQAQPSHPHGVDLAPEGHPPKLAEKETDGRIAIERYAVEVGAISEQPRQHVHRPHRDTVELRRLV